MRLVLSMLAAALATAAPCGCARPTAPTDASSTVQSAEPGIAQMQRADQVGGKISVPVEVRYRLQGVAAKNQPATLQLAFVPRIAGTNLRVEFPAAQSASIDTGGMPLAVAKADTAGAYRRNLLITPRSGDSAEVRVIVSMEVNGGRYFGIFTIPVGAAQAQKPPVKDRSPTVR